MPRPANQQSVLNILENLNGLEPLKELFWNQLSYARVNASISRKGWNEPAAKALADDPLVFAGGGEKDRAREWISRALAIDPDDPLTQYNLACGYTRLGDIDAAFDLLERSLPRAGPEIRQWIKHDSDFDPLRTHPRYQKILELIG